MPSFPLLLEMGEQVEVVPSAPLEAEAVGCPLQSRSAMRDTQWWIIGVALEYRGSGMRVSWLYDVSCDTFMNQFRKGSQAGHDQRFATGHCFKRGQSEGFA